MKRGKEGSQLVQGDLFNQPPEERAVEESLRKISASDFQLLLKEGRVLSVEGQDGVDDFSSLKIGLRRDPLVLLKTNQVIVDISAGIELRKPFPKTAELNTEFVIADGDDAKSIYGLWLNSKRIFN